MLFFCRGLASICFIMVAFIIACNFALIDLKALA